jgi:hypothetical protein
LNRPGSKLLEEKLNGSTRALSMLQGGFKTAKRKRSELSCGIMLVAKLKEFLKENIKVLNKTIKTLKSKIDNQLGQKKTNAVKMQ